MTATRTAETSADDERRSGVRLSDLHISVSFTRLRLDAEACETLGRHVKELTIGVWSAADGADKEELRGELDCFLFDAIGADRLDESLWPEADYVGESREFYEFLFTSSDFVRAKLLHRIAPSLYSADDEDDDDGELYNVLCVEGGWWAYRPEVLAHLLERLRCAVRFHFVCVDMAHVRTTKCKKWRKERPPTTPMSLPAPFKKVAWNEITDPAHLVGSARDRFFWIAALYEGDSLPQMSDDERVQLGAVRSKRPS